MIAIDPRKTWDYVLVNDRTKPCPDCTNRLNDDGPVGHCSACNGKLVVPTTKNERTVHKLKHLSIAEEHKAFDGLEATPDGRSFARKDLGTDSLRILRAGYAGCTNFRDRDGNEIPFERGPNGAVSDDFLARLSLTDRMELARAIELELVMTEDELGKSEPPST